VETVQAVGGTLLGTVVNFAPGATAAGYGYGYGYGERTDWAPQADLRDEQAEAMQRR
jgi:hypothetical protein